MTRVWAHKLRSLCRTLQNDFEKHWVSSGNAGPPPGDGPAFDGRAEWVDDRPDLETALLRAYHRKYWLLVPLFMGRYIRKGLARKTSVLIQVTPAGPRER